MNGEDDMCVNDSSFMLFGNKIPVPEYHIPMSSQNGCKILANSTIMNTCINSKHTESLVKSKNSSNISDCKQESLHKENESSSTNQDKVHKKPDKIVQCARCNSFDTKFCYFNNYNLNQPRHFCRTCHRYWTAGGTMRNVAFGAGRRKNKHIASQYCHINEASHGTPSAHLETNESSAVFRCSNNSSIVLKFVPDNTSLHESNHSMFNPKNRKTNIVASANNCRENGEEESSLCVSAVTNGYTRGTELLESEHNRSKPMQSYPASSWIIPLNESWNNVTSMVQSSMQMCNPYGIDSTAMQWCHTPMVAVTNIFTPNIGMQYRNESVSIGSNGCISPSSSTTCNGSPILSKDPQN